MANTRTTSCCRTPQVPHPARVRVRVHARVRGTAALAGLLAGGILLAGCSDSSNTTSPPPSDTSSTSPSPSATPTMTVYGTVEEQKASLPKSHDGMQTGAVMNRAVATNPEEEAVADAWLRYWQVLAKSFMDAKLDPAARDAIATGEAAERITKLTNARKAANDYTHGVIILNPTRILINGNTATVLDCALDESRDVYADGTVEHKGINTHGFRAILKKSGKTWLTDRITTDDKLCTNKGMERG
jgi:hypothetical protein